MFREADVNKDGQLTFMEWYEWLGAASVPVPVPIPVQGSPVTSPTSAASGADIDTGSDTTKSTAAQGAMLSSSSSAYMSPTDPMITALSIVLGNAVCTLKTAARLSQDPSALSAAFISGGMMVGVLDAQVKQPSLQINSGFNKEHFKICTLLFPCTSAVGLSNHAIETVACDQVNRGDSILLRSP
jgi:hypothetical protein